MPEMKFFVKQPSNVQRVFCIFLVLLDFETRFSTVASMTCQSVLEKQFQTSFTSFELINTDNQSTDLNAVLNTDQSVLAKSYQITGFDTHVGSISTIILLHKEVLLTSKSNWIKLWSLFPIGGQTISSETIRG